MIVLFLEHAKKKIISNREINSAVKAFFTDNLANHAISQAKNQLITISLSNGNKTYLIIPYTLVMMKLNDIIPEYKMDAKIERKACIFLTAVIEYILVEIMELSSNVARGNKRFTIKESDIQKAIHNDEELKKTLCRLGV